MLLEVNLLTIILMICSIAFGAIIVKILKKKKIKIIFNCMVYIIYILIAIILTQKILYQDNRYLNFYLYQVSSGSMRNTLQVNDYILVKKSIVYKEGDIITYQLEDRTITHRIVKISGDAVTTKGDANFNVDEPIHKKQIIGKVVCHGKGLNLVVKYISYILISFATSYLVSDLIIKKK